VLEQNKNSKEFDQIKTTMKLLLALILCFGSSSLPLLSDEIETRRSGQSAVRTCTRREYREQYMPGTPENPGYVKNWYEYVEIPCDGRRTDLDTNDCTEGSLLGGILGAGIAASSSRGKGRFWAVPAGGVTGALIGCQVDGG
tara:strand:+ start:73494 stop:73919 length:426 start_codon:yes stop_codon:yes gene_type:complete